MKETDIEMIMAHADGQLPAEQLAQVQALLAQDAQARHMLAQFKQTSALLDPVAREMLHEPVPQRLIDTVRQHPRARDAAVQSSNRSAAAEAPAQDSIVSRSAANDGQFWPRWATAASVALAVGLVTGHWWSGQDAGAGKDLAQVLQTVPSGTSVSLAGGSLMPLASFLRANGQACREFEQASAGRLSHGIACRSEGGWVTQVLIDRGTDLSQIGQPPAFAPASGQADALSAVAEALNLGQVLEPQQEEQLIRRGWSAQP